MANWFSVFQNDPKRMPGQGLASPDYDFGATKSQYNQLLGLYTRGLDSYAPRMAAGRLKGLDALLNGTAGQAGLGETYLEGIRTADPENARLLDLLTEDATNELELGNQLDPAQQRMIEQSVRAGGAARGMGFGPADVWQETFEKTGYGDTLRDKRRANALNLQQLRQLLVTRPIDRAIDATVSVSPETAMWGVLGDVYGNNQANARTKAQLETGIGQHQADVWNGWFKTAAAAI